MNGSGLSPRTVNVDEAGSERELAKTFIAAVKAVSVDKERGPARESS